MVKSFGLSTPYLADGHFGCTARFWDLPNTMEKNKFNGEIFPFYSIIIQILLPLLLLIIGTLKEKKRSKQVNK
ncbi:hypothetical protein ACI2OX_18575 [Bacillus sp. N9]